MSTIFIIDDDEELCNTLKFHLRDNGHEVNYSTNASRALEALDGLNPDLILLDLNLPDRSGLEVLKSLQESHTNSPVVMITGEQDMNATIEAMRSGAFDYLRKPFELDDVLILIEKIQRFNPLLKKHSARVITEAVSEKPLEIIGSSKKIVEVIKQIGLLSRSHVTVLIEGESGTGKELVARALHEATSPGKPFVAINCSSVVSTLLESELFGHEKGAFTGAVSLKKGKLDFAENGSVFLDEIGDMPFELQAKILRVLQQKVFERVGGLESIAFNSRVITATNRNLASLVEKGEFREDLYYRLAVTRINLPSLREHTEDIPLLVRHLIGRIARSLHRNVEGIEQEAISRMQRYDWPGNVRELENVLSRAVALAKGAVISADDLEFSLGGVKSEVPAHDKILPLWELEKKHIEKTLIATGWNITQTAKTLQIAPNTLRNKISKFSLRKPL